MKFEDLSEFDLNLIKSNGVYTLVNTRVSNRYEALAIVMLGCIHAKGFNLSKEPKDLLKRLTHDLPVSSLYGTDNQPADLVIKKVFDLLASYDISLIKDESRLPTWSTPSESWYTRSDNRKKPWVV